MKKNLVLLVPGIITALSFVPCKKELSAYRFFPDYQTGYKASVFDASFEWGELSLLNKEGMGVDDRLWLSAVGDVTGDSEYEIIITHSKGMDILNQKGEILSTLKEPGYIVESILLHDIDKDGKDEILLGKQGILS